MLSNRSKEPAFGRRWHHRTIELGDHVVPVGAVHRAGLQAALQEGEELVRQQDVDVRRQHVSRAGPADADVFGDHLVDRQPVRVGHCCVQVVRNRDHCGMKVLRLVPSQRIPQRRPAGRRIPLHQKKLDGHAEPLCLLRQPVDEELHAGEQVSSVVVVARGRDDGQLGRVHGATTRRRRRASERASPMEKTFVATSQVARSPSDQRGLSTVSGDMPERCAMAITSWTPTPPATMSSSLRYSYSIRITLRDTTSVISAVITYVATVDQAAPSIPKVGISAKLRAMFTAAPSPRNIVPSSGRSRIDVGALSMCCSVAKKLANAMRNTTEVAAKYSCRAWMIVSRTGADAEMKTTSAMPMMAK